MTPPATIFSAAPDWSDTFVDKPSYLTDIFTAADDTEQRIQLRGVPNRTLSWSVLCMTARESATVDAMIYAHQASRIGVPMWPEITALAAAVSPGDASLALDTTFRSFGSALYALLWRDMWTYEMVGIADSGVSDTSIDLTATTVNAWPLGTAVLPLLIGYHAASLSRTRPSRDTVRVPVSFAIEVIPQ